MRRDRLISPLKIDIVRERARAKSDGPFRPYPRLEFDGHKRRFTTAHHGEDGRMCIGPVAMLIPLNGL